MGYSSIELSRRINFPGTYFPHRPLEDTINENSINQKAEALLNEDLVLNQQHKAKSRN